MKIFYFWKTGRNFYISGIPGLDMFELFIFRIVKGKNPFSADLNHIHHLILRNIIVLLLYSEFNSDYRKYCNLLFCIVKQVICSHINIVELFSIINFFNIIK